MFRRTIRYSVKTQFKYTLPLFEILSEFCVAKVHERERPNDFVIAKYNYASYFK